MPLPTFITLRSALSPSESSGSRTLCKANRVDLPGSNYGRVLSFKRITYVVLDEAGRMFDMGFERQS
ncbi:pre-mRNA-processing ATP-dependent RNA helicase PRP5 [Pyrenophora tritici-repentis]|uniref:DEAD/DEAH box helicase n=1 Tax=Pyrenophora tritici-repentis TaxID=45151 RepID=A0A2W1D134_9PLEO|nr:pre-mRNA-processing ATP-dependent RNA helicase PRP5 [Pyrenophora tritici-repentis]KAI0607307.1 pre-mRNA-processing ATP-dependent RNA helicase PRP5 [Pyrenophora tritici-repentis]KAI0622490.1 pre-mRNA-processing ATP-dependent RNA helicase PRP5 [Pyrenophora tritici-repentis]KAI1509849.1 DEAD/DEAH box helicase [Pyrenophora tritici-repentis]KAI1532793.1 SrmB Superfamily II DNA and RNA helicase [Pyrenophora tritici-repentis]